MGRCTSLIGLKGRRGRRNVIQCLIWYGSVEMRGKGGRQVNEVGRAGEEKGWDVPISVVNALTCNMDPIAWIGSRYALSKIELRSLRVPFGSWHFQGYGCPAS